MYVNNMILPYQLYEKPTLVRTFEKFLYMRFPEQQRALENQIVTDLRPYMNAILSHLKLSLDKFMISIQPENIKVEGKLREELLNIQQIELFIVGGDAINRFTDDNSQMTDIDAKIYITPKQANSIGTFSNVLKQYILSFLSSQFSNYLVKLHETFNFKRRTNPGDRNNYIFRLRRGDFSRPYSRNQVDINRSKFLIFSIDTLVDTLVGENYEYSILDVSIVYNGDKEDFRGMYNTQPLYDAISRDKTEYTINVANAKFISKDIEDMYKKQITALNRVKQDKVEKDINRYIFIKRVSNTMSPHTVDTNAVDNDFMKQLFTFSRVAVFYRTEFDGSVGKRYQKTPFLVRNFNICNSDTSLLQRIEMYPDSKDAKRKIILKRKKILKLLSDRLQTLDESSISNLRNEFCAIMSQGRNTAVLGKRKFSNN